MQVVFIRHADAEPAGADGDAARKLTGRGTKQARRTAEALKLLDVQLEVILSSPLTRAVQTAELAAKAHRDARTEVAEFLAPPVEPTALTARLAELDAQGVGSVALVGHTPSLEETVGLLVFGTRSVPISLSKAGAICVQIDPADKGKGGALRWLIQRKQLAYVAKSEKG
jgi:phosphohistidine phosphatase